MIAHIKTEIPANAVFLVELPCLMYLTLQRLQIILRLLKWQILDLTILLLSHDPIVDGPDSQRPDTLLEYKWTGICKCLDEADNCSWHHSANGPPYDFLLNATSDLSFNKVDLIIL